MQRLLCFGALVAVAAVLAMPAQAQPPNTYVVVLKAAVDARGVAALHSHRYGLQVDHVYAHALYGYSAVIPNERVAAVRADEHVAYVEEDAEMTASVQSLPWGIDRIDADVSSTLAGNGSGAVSNVNVYVIDTGVGSHGDLNLVAHTDFVRKRRGNNTDCHGHGTHVAGTVAASDNTIDVVGAAPGAAITGVKVLGCNGSGTTSGVIAGVDWVTANSAKPAVANMSLGGGASQALDDAVKRSADSGVFYAVAAGNESTNACTRSPARAGAHSGVVAVAATDSADREASWSNYGSCVDIWAPGVSILSTRLGGGTTTMSGTSMASPHVAGAAALYLSSHAGASAGAVEAALKANDVTPGTTSKDGRSITLANVGNF